MKLYVKKNFIKEKIEVDAQSNFNLLDTLGFNSKVSL
jgi:hypothetical protein